MADAICLPWPLRVDALVRLAAALERRSRMLLEVAGG